MLRRLAIGIASLVGAVLLLFAAAFGYAQTRLAKDQIGELIASQLSSPTQKAEVEQLAGLLPFDVRIGRFALTDKAGTWLEVEDARVKVAPTALLSGRVHVQEAGARRVAVERLPPGEPAAAKAETVGLPQPPALPTALPVVAIDRLYVDTLELGAPVLGRAATFAIAGRVATNDAGTAVEAALELRRTDEATAQVTVSAGADLAAQTLRLDLSATETGGLVGSAIGRPEAGAARLSLTGAGPLSDFRAQLRGDVERLARLEADLALAWAGRSWLELTAALEAEPGALPEAYADLLGQRATIALAAGEMEPGIFVLDRLSVEAAAVRAGGSGRLAIDAGSIEGNITLQLPDLARASKIAGMELAGSVDLTATAPPGAERPAVELRVDGRELLFNSFALASLGAGLKLVPAAPLAEGWQGADVSGTVQLRDAALGGEPLHPVPDLDVTLDLGVPAQGAIALRDLRAAGGPLLLTGSGSFEPTELAGTLDLALDARDLASLLEAFGPLRPQGVALAGSAQLTAEVGIAQGLSAVDATLALATRELSGLPPGAAELLGGAPMLSAQIRYADGKALAVSDLTLTGAGAKLEGAVTYALADGGLGGGLTLTVPELAMLEPAVGQPIAGRASLRADFGGTLETPDLKGRFEAAPFAIAGQAFDQLAATATAAGPAASPRGSVVVAASRGGQQAQLLAQYETTANTVRLPTIALDAPATRLAGEARIRLDGPLVDGRLAGAVEDLAALESWIGQKLAGAVRLDARFEVVDSSQNATLQVDLFELLGNFGGLYAASLAARVEDLFGAPRLQAKLDAREFTQPGLRVKTATAEVSGPGDDLRLGASLEGEAAEPFALRAQAALALLGPRKRLILQTVEGTLGQRQLVLRKPATATLENGVLEIDELDLLLGEGEIRGGFRLDDAQVRGFARIQRLPLATVAAFTGAGVAGEAGLDLRLEGPAAAPRLSLSGELRALRPADDLYGELPSADLSFRGGVKDGRFALEFAVTRLEGTTASGRIAGPLRLGLRPFSLDIDPTEPLTGSVNARVELATLVALAGLDGQKVEGPLTVALAISGTPAAPRLDGTASIEGARIEDSITGVVMTDLVLLLEGDGQRLRLVRLQAGDGREGRLEASGTLRLDGLRGFAYDVRCQLDHFTISNNPLLFAVANATLSAAGNARRGRISGQVEIESAEIGIPSGGGADIPELEVIESGDGTPPWRPDLAAFRRTAGDSSYALALDVRVDMPARIFIRGRGLRSEWGGSLHLAGTVAAPVIEGTIAFRRGYLDLLDERFVIREGEIRFVGFDPPQPWIRLLAAAEGEDMTAILRLDGPMADPRFELNSEPELPRDEILARLLFGRDVSGITPIQGLRLAAALQRLEGGGDFDLLAGLRETIGVDTLEVAGASPAETYVSAGKYVTENVFVEVEQRLATGETKARVEVELTERLTVVSETDNSRSGVELEWRYDY